MLQQRAVADSYPLGVLIPQDPPTGLTLPSRDSTCRWTLSQFDLIAVNILKLLY